MARTLYVFDVVFPIKHLNAVYEHTMNATGSPDHTSPTPGQIRNSFWCRNTNLSGIKQQ
jgi:hypothetical protein